MLVGLAGWWSARRVWGLINNIEARLFNWDLWRQKYCRAGDKKQPTTMLFLLQRYFEVFQLVRKFEKGLSVSWEFHMWEGVPRRDIQNMLSSSLLSLQVLMKDTSTCEAQGFSLMHVFTHSASERFDTIPYPGYKEVVEFSSNLIN